MPARCRLDRFNSLVKRAFPLAAGAGFAAFVVANGVPTLRHDWNWPIDRLALPSFLSEAVSGWLSSGYGVANPHPTTYLVALPIAGAIWLFGSFVALALVSLVVGYCCTATATSIAARWKNGTAASIGIALFALFNPWVYNEVVAGHLIMVLAYAGLLGLSAEMLAGEKASPVRLALWIALVEAQLQFYIVGMLALFVFALTTKKWMPLLAGAVIALPSIVGVLGERGVLLQTPYSVQWQANQSLSPLPLLALGGYFPGYADRLGTIAQIAVWAIVALAVAGIVIAYRRRAVLWAAAAAAFVYAAGLGLNGPFAAPYDWIVRRVPESGVFRELYDLAGVFAVLLAVLACVAAVRVRALGYVALAAGALLPLGWFLHPPAAFWISASAYPHPAVSAPPFSRVALLPAFQPLELRSGGGDGADPDAFVYPGGVAALNVYFPTYPVDMALARYERFGDISALQSLGVAQIVARPWLRSRSNGGIGLAARSLGVSSAGMQAQGTRELRDAAPLVAGCDAVRVVSNVDRLTACDVFVGDAPNAIPVTAIAPQSDSIDVASAWIDARLAFARDPALAQGLGGTLTQSTAPHGVLPASWLLVYVRGSLTGSDGRRLDDGTRGFAWIWIPPSVAAVRCNGLCELIADSPAIPAIPIRRAAPNAHGLAFAQFTPWLLRVRDAGSAPALLRLNERYDPAWIAIAAWHVLPHVRLNIAANGWFLGERAETDVVLVQTTALLQLIAELAGIACVILLLKALVREPTKRA